LKLDGGGGGCSRPCPSFTLGKAGANSYTDYATPALFGKGNILKFETSPSDNIYSRKNRIALLTVQGLSKILNFSTCYI